MLEGDEEIDWAGYSAPEVIDQYAHRQGVSGQALGWWTRKEFDRFTQMANSVEAVGMRSRHKGRRFSAPKKPPSPKKAAGSCAVLTTRWLAWLLAPDEPTRDPGETASRMARRGKPAQPGWSTDSQREAGGCRSRHRA
jgi:hypothetical protein